MHCLQAGQIEYVASMHLSQPQKRQRMLEHGELAGESRVNAAYNQTSASLPKKTNLLEVWLAGVYGNPGHFAIRFRAILMGIASAFGISKTISSSSTTSSS
jgi:hypothetical protein